MHSHIHTYIHTCIMEYCSCLERRFSSPDGGKFIFVGMAKEEGKVHYEHCSRHLPAIGMVTVRQSIDTAERQ